MAQAQLKNPEADKNNALIVQMGTPLTVDGLTKGEPKNTAQLPTYTSTQALNLVRLFNIVQMLQDPSKRTDAASQDTYSKAVAAWGSESKAVDALNNQIIALVKYLDSKGVSGTLSNVDSVGGAANFTAMQAMFAFYADKVRSMDSYYLDPAHDFNDIDDEMTRIQDSVKKGTAYVAVKPKDAVATTPEYLSMPTPEFTRGSVHLLDVQGSSFVLGANLKLTDPVLSAFGQNATAAQKAVTSYGQAIVALNDPHVSDADRSQAAKNLSDAMKAIPQNNPLWKNPGFKNAINLLSQGNLKDGLAALGQIPQLSSIRGLIPNTYIVTLRNEAIEVWNVSAKVRIPLDPQSKLAFQRMLSSPQSEYSLRVLDAIVGVSVSGLKFVGFSQQFVTDQSGNLVPKGSPQQVLGSGTAVTVPLGMSFGLNLGRPFELVLKAEPGWIKSEAGATFVRPLGGMDTVDASSQGFQFMMGFWGLEVNPLVRTFERPLFWLDKVGFGPVGDPSKGNLLAYVTTSLRYMEGEKLSLRSYISADFLRFAGEYRVGGSIVPVEIAYRTKVGTFAFDPNLRLEGNVNNGLMRWQADGRITWMPNSGWQIYAGGGAVWETGGPDYMRLPTTPIVMGGVVMTLPDAFKSRASDAVPVKRGVDLSGAAPKYKDALDFKGDMNSEDAKKLCKDLAEVLDIYTIDAPSVRNNSEYQKGIEYLKSGDLMRARESLQNVPEIKALGGSR